jgi:hypothetical protein
VPIFRGRVRVGAALAREAVAAMTSFRAIDGLRTAAWSVHAGLQWTSDEVTRPINRCFYQLTE